MRKNASPEGRRESAEFTRGNAPTTGSTWTGRAASVAVKCKWKTIVCCVCFFFLSSSIPFHIEDIDITPAAKFTAEWQHITKTPSGRPEKFHQQTTPTDDRKIYIGAFTAVHHESEMPMESADARSKILGELDRALKIHVIRDRRFLDDEQLIRAEQIAVLEEIFNANVRDREIREISRHFAPVLRDDHPFHLALWGKTGTGKTLTISYVLSLLAERCAAKRIPLRHVHVDLSTPRPCFRALNDLACLLNASKRYKKGISLEELMLRTEASLADFRGYLVIFVDEVDNVRRDKDAFLAFLVRRLPQRIPAQLILVFASNRLNWTDHVDPRIRSFLKLNELYFQPYDALDLQRILRIRVDKALHRKAVTPGVVEKIAALSSRDHGDARQAVALLARSALCAERGGTPITLDIVDEAAEQIERDRYVTMIRTAPPQLQAVLAGAITACRSSARGIANTGDVYQAYREFCERARFRPVALRAFGDLVAELDLYTFLRTRVRSNGRYGRTREITFELDDGLMRRLLDAILVNFQLQGRPER
jgi:cell division control protein 6